MKVLRLLWMALQWCASCVGHVALWTLWLFLGTLLVLQIVIACSHELRVPSLLIKSFEHRLALAGLHASFDSASFDPAGHVLVERLRLFSDSFEEPLVTCESLFVTLDPWSLTIGSIEAQSLRGRGLALYVPPMFSPSGQSEPVLRDVDFAIQPNGKEIALEKLIGRAGPLSLVAHGGLRLQRSRVGAARNQREVVAEAVSRYIQAARQLALWQAKLAPFENPSVSIELTPDDYRIARAALTFTTARADFTRETLGLPSLKQPIHVSKIRLQSALPLVLGPQVALEAVASADTIQGDDGSEATHFAAKLNGVLQTIPLRFQTRELVGSLERVASHGVEVGHLSLSVDPQAWPQLKVGLSAAIADQSWAVATDLNPSASSGRLSAKGEISPALLGVVGKKIGRNLQDLVAPEAPAAVTVDAEFAPGWKPSAVHAHFEVGKVVARGVSIDRASGDLEYAGTEFRATDVVLAQGKNLALGSYTMDTKSLDYRFLLTGHLRPVDISGWFHDWWPRFWSSFDFSAAPPEADVDVQGRWRDPHLTTVFVFADCVSPIIRAVPFDRVRISLFIRPDFYDGMEFLVTRRTGQARGHFTRSVDLDQHGFRRMDFAADSTLDIQETARLFGPSGIDLVDPFRFEKPPNLKLSGWLEGEASPNGEHQKVDIEVASQGAFNFFGFPVNDLNCRATVHDHEITVSGLRLHFADGEARGNAQVSGRGDERKLAFDVNLEDATLGESIRILEEFGAKRRGEKPPEVSRFQQRVASGKINLTASAAGLYKDPYSFIGGGTAELKGAELAEINMLGALSQALRDSSLLGFTSWRLDTAQTSFSIDHNKLILPDLHITGPTARLDAHGSYALDSKLINLNAKFYPFEQGKTLLANAVGFVLAPVSAVLELHLAGSLAQPKWYFAYGPTSLLRKLAGTDQKVETGASEKPAQTPPLLLRR